MRSLACHLHRVRVFLPALALAAAVPQTLARHAPTPPPTLQPDETASAFIERWNEWTYATDPDQQLRKDLQAANDAAWNELRTVGERFNVYWPLDTITEPGHWTAAQMAAERIAPHTARLRELLTRPHHAVPFPATEVEAARRAERTAYFENNPPKSGAVAWDPGPMPANQLEMYLIDIGTPSEVRTAVSRLRLETNYALQIGNLGLAGDNIIASFEGARLLLDRDTVMDALYRHTIESTAVSSVESVLARHGRRMRDGVLERIQTAMLAHAEHRRGLAESLQLEQRVMAELLPTWFDPEQPDRLTDRGRAFLDAISLTGVEPNWLDPDFRFSLRTRPSFEESLAPVSEQVRVFNAITAAYARDSATPWHAREDLESTRLFKAIVAADPHGRLAPALDRFTLYNSHIWSDLRSETSFRAALTLLGVHRHRAITGAWPATLADIDPTVMRFDPIDPHSGQPFGYAVIDDQPTLWSFGPDRDNDDGRPIPEPPAPPEGELPRVPSLAWFTLNEWAALPPEVQAEYDGDIVLFPPRTRD